ncbi:MAG: bZIP transcription factor [Chitinophagaceae bacterium]
MRKSCFISLFFIVSVNQMVAQVTDTVPAVPAVIPDTPLRITNLNPYFTLQVDSMLLYQLSINKDQKKYYWYLRNSPAGMKINKDNGLLSYKADRAFFLSGKLRYDQEYNVKLGVQSLNNPADHIDTSFTLVFFNTEIINPKIKFTVSNNLVIEEGQPVNFTVLCEAGNFPIEDILFSSSVPITGYNLVKHCDEQFSWTPSFDFVSAKDTNSQKTVVLSFVGSTRFSVKDTASVRVTVKDALNYPYAVQEHAAVVADLNNYVLQLKFAFFQLDKKVRGTKGARTGFDLTAASTALTGTILNTSASTSSQNTGKVLPSVGVALTPIKEATAPNKTVEQNQAAVIRSAIRRLDYMERENQLVGERDPDIQQKTARLRDEVRQVRTQLVDIPLEAVSSMSEAELTRYMNSKKVRKKYGLSKK